MSEAVAPEAPGVAPSCIIVSLMREKGTTGVQTHIAMAADVLRESGFQVTVLTPFSGRSIFRTPLFALRYLFAPLSGTLEIFWLRYGHYLYLKRALKRHQRKEKNIDVIYAHCPLSTKAATETRDATRTRVATAIHFNRSQAFEWEQRGKIKKDGWLYRQMLRLEEQVLPQADARIYFSDYMRRQIGARIPATLDGPPYVIPNFTRFSVPKPQALRGDLISIGTLEPRKNQQYTLRVLAELKRRGLQPRLTIVGDGEDRRRLATLAQTLRIAEQVHFAGHVPDGASLLAAHRLCLHAATLENCSIVLLEALGKGVPIVAANNGGTPEILQDGRNGKFWNLEDVAQGADVVQSLLEDDEMYRRMSQQATQDFAERYSFDSAGRQLGAALRQIGSTAPSGATMTTQANRSREAEA